MAGRMEQAAALWMRLYRGDAPWAGEGMVSMELAPFIAGEVARLATVEMQARVTAGRVTAGEGDEDSGRAAFLQAQLDPVVDRARVICELAAAGGSVMLKPYIDGGRIAVDAVRAGDFTPLAWDADGRITGCAFYDRREADGKRYVRREVHTLHRDGYRIENRAYVGDGLLGRAGREVSLSVVDAWADLLPDAWMEGVTEPLFAHLRMPYANNIDPDSPLGVAAYARAVPLLREADRQFSRLIWEMHSGERALYVDMRAMEELGDGGEGSLPMRRLYRMIDTDPQTGSLFEAWSPQLREQSQIAALNEILQRVEDACGLSRGTLSEAPESAARGARTATELKIMRQRTYTTVRETQKAVEVAMRGLVRAMDVWAGVGGLAPEGDWRCAFLFDDSVVCDRSEEFLERVKLVEMGVMTGLEMREWYFGASLR